MGKPHSLLRHLVNIGCLVILGAVATERFPAHIVGHDENDVGLALIAAGQNGNQANGQNQRSLKEKRMERFGTGAGVRIGLHDFDSDRREGDILIALPQAKSRRAPNQIPNYHSGDVAGRSQALILFWKSIRL